MLIRKTVKNYIKQLTSAEAAPGGGSASALAGALGVSLILMVSGITRKHLSGEARKNLDKTIRYLRKFLRDIENIIDLDARVYRQVVLSYRRAKKTKNKQVAERNIEASLSQAFRLQMDLALLIAMAKETLPAVQPFVKGPIGSDLLVARGFLNGAFRGAVTTARVNVNLIHSPKREHYEDSLVRLEKKYNGAVSESHG